MTKNTPTPPASTREELLPPGPLRSKWNDLLEQKRSEPDDTRREYHFQFAHGWLRALVDVGVLSDAAMPELRELLISAKPTK